MKKVFTFLSLCIVSFYFSQQTEGLRDIKKKYDIVFDKLDIKFKHDTAKKTSSKKLEGIMAEKNKAATALEIKRNAEYLEELSKIKENEKNNVFDTSKLQVTDETGEVAAKYPKGNTVFRNEIANNFYTDGVDGQGKISCELYFIIERDGSMVEVKGIGQNESFNRQAELAIYLINDKWDPARLNGQPVRYRMRVPLTLNFD